MIFSDMRDKIVILSPTASCRVNSMGEMSPLFVPFNPYTSYPITEENPPAFAEEGKVTAEICDECALEKYKIWAKVVPLKGREYQEAQMLRSETTYKVKLRYADNILESFKIIYRGKLLEVISVLNIDGRCKELSLICAEIKNN